MSKILLYTSFLLLPVFAAAQSDAPVYKDFAKKIGSTVNSFNLNDHVCVMQFGIDDENFNLVAIDDKMQVVWRTTLKGEPYTAGKFTGHILAIAVAEKRDLITYTGFLIDEKTGNTLLQKVIYESKAENEEPVRAFFSEDGPSFKLVARETGAAKSGIFKSNKYNESRDFTIVDLNEKLEAAVSKPAIPDGDFVAMTCNDQGDLFVFTCQEDKTIKAVKYESGKIKPGTPVVQDIDLRSKDDVGSGDAFLFPSKTDKNVVYFAMAYRNNNKDRQLTIGKFDFNTHTAQLNSEVFDRAHVKSLEKAFVPLDKKMDKPTIGSGSGMMVRHFEEYNGMLLLALSDRFSGQTNLSTTPGAVSTAANTASYLQGNAIIVDAFDLKLQPKFEQVLPIVYQWYYYLNEAYHAGGNFFYVLATNSSHKRGVSYAKIDLTTGNLVKFELHAIDSKHILDTDALWFKDSFMIPLSYPTGILPPHKQTIDLQLNAY